MPRRPETLLVMDRDTFCMQFGDTELARLGAAASLGDPVTLDELTTPVAWARLQTAEVLITSWGCPPLDAGTVAAAPELRAVLHAAGSVRAHVTDAVFDRGILVTTAADANAEPVARYTLAAILWSLKRVPFLAAEARHRHWVGWAYADPRRSELSGTGRTVALIGFSRIGRRVAALLGSFPDIRVLVVDPVADPAEITRAGAEPAPLAKAIPRADVLSLHAPLLPETRRMIGAAELSALSPGATLINTARGELIDPAALEMACLSGLQAVLDVTDPEPLPPGSPLYELPNVVLTPHVAGSLGAETRLMTASALTEIERYAAGLPPLTSVTAESLRVQA
jgi:phosphoglycerate dehydrogenase-like enzyme